MNGLCKYSPQAQVNRCPELVGYGDIAGSMSELTAEANGIIGQTSLLKLDREAYVLREEQSMSQNKCILDCDCAARAPPRFTSYREAL
ncbi:MAG: hypothetical protein CL912_07330 [Deltaproteobacteria bacterium]|nr:hypothetical protein [Deltaproteobacteria bacterium]